MSPVDAPTAPPPDGAPSVRGPEAPPPVDTAIQPILGDLLTTAVRRLVNRSRAEFGRAARSGRQKLEERQLQRDLDHFWVRLGKSAYHLVQAGELDHPALRKAMARIDDLEARIDALRSTQQPTSQTDPRSALAPTRADD